MTVLPSTSSSVTSEVALLSKQDIATWLGYTTRSIDRLVASGKIPYLALPAANGKGRKIKFDRRAIEAWLNGAAVVKATGEDN